jgi:hypothetical protein
MKESPDRLPRVNVAISEEMKRYLEMKAKLRGQPVATIAGSIIFDAMVSESKAIAEVASVLASAPND